MAEHDAQTGALLREYVWLDTMPLAMVTGPAATPSYTWITTGNLNEPLLLTNAAGAITASTTRDPWGNPILLAGGAPLDLGYPGQWRDPAIGLFQNWHRDYDPTLGRYAQADPLGLGGCLLSEVASGSGVATQTITYSYDAVAGGNRGIGRLTGVSDPSGAEALVYDAQGRVIGDTL